MPIDMGVEDPVQTTSADFSSTIVNQFAEYLLNNGKYPKTIESYTTDVAAFLTWLNSKGLTFNRNLKYFYITTYKAHLLANNYQINTINKKINSLQSFNHYLISMGYTKEMVVKLGRDKVKTAAGSEHEVDVFTDEEVEKILFYIQDPSKVTIRDKMIVYLLLYTGVRVSELISIKIKDVDFIINNLKVIGKGGKYREIPMKAEVVEVIKEYLATERKDNKHHQSEYLILSQRAPKTHRDAVNRLLRNLGKKLNIEIYPHKFRHTFCTILLRKGVDIATVGKLAGHSSIQTTVNSYIQTSRQDKMNAVNLL